MSDLEVLVRGVIGRLCNDLKNEKFVPILESDIIAHIYHLMILEGVSVASIHVNSRVVGLKNENEKIDLVIGEVIWREDGKRAVRPHLIAEVKAFFKDFSDQQCRRCFTNLIGELNEKEKKKRGDLEKLGEVDCGYKYMLIFDEKGYLQGTYGEEKREHVLKKKRDRIAPDARILIITPRYELKEL